MRLRPPQPATFVALAVLAACTDARRAPRAEVPGGITSAPLRAAVGGEAPRFRRLDPAACGLRFTNELRPENRYQYLTNGAGLAVGDYDGDGLPDVYLVSQDGPNRLFRQTAPLQFADVTGSAGGVDGGEAWGTGAVFADVDGDGDLDLYVCNLESKNLLYENQGDGTFRENAARYGLDLVAASAMAAFADYDNDGKLDLYLLTNRALHAGWALTPEVLDGMRAPATAARTPRQMVPTQEQLAQIGARERKGELRRDADLPPELREHFLTFRGKTFMTGAPDRLLRRVGARFVDVTASAGIAGHGMGLSATWWDYDGDGYPDLYVANDLESPDTLYHNQQDGTFRDVTAAVLPHTAYYGMGSDAGDVDGDGRLDFLVADMSMTTHKQAKVLMGDMTRQRDVLLHMRPPQYMRNALLLNTGLGCFQEAGILAGVASTDWTWSVLFGDLDNDARLDLFATNGIARFDTDPDLELRVQQLWAQNRRQAAIDLIQNVRKVPEQNLALRNTGDLQFAKTGADWGLDLEAVTHGAALVDLDGDGDLDVLVNNWNEPAAVYENRTTDGRAITLRLVGQKSERFGVGARVTATLADGRQLVREVSLARGYLSGQTTDLHFGVGTAAAVASLQVRWPSGHGQAFTDLAAGRHYTITEPPGAPAQAAPTPTAPTTFVAGSAPPFRHQENEFDEYVDQPLLPAGVSRLGPGMALGDADGDGRDDLFVGGAQGQAGALFLASEGGWRARPGPWQQDAASEDMGVLWLDVDGDGDLDLFVASGGAEAKPGDAALRDRVYRNDGTGTFTRDDTVLPDVRESSGHACAGDFDRDGDLDLFVAGRLVPGRFPDAPPSHLYRNDGGTFVDVTAELAPGLHTAGMVTSALFTDVDDDGWPDLLVAAHWQPVRLLHNDGGKAFRDRTAAAGLAPHTGWWNSLCAWDCDADGDLDYVAGNQGWNTKYKASPAHPARLFFGDFDDNGTRDLIEAKYEGDHLLPVRGRSCSSQAMPFLAEKFKTYEAFASSLLQDIYPQDKLAAAGTLEATTLASCLLRNDGAGHFTVEPLPRRAQIAPIFGMVALGDLLVCAQNSFTPEPETGRHDGGTGLVIRGTAAGLEVVPPGAHGIGAFGDHKSLVVTGDGTLLDATNDGPVLAWHAPALARTQVALPASKGNPQSVGARVVLEFADGRRRAVEVQAGAGYLSQSPPWFESAPRAVVRAADGSTATVERAR
ncbi:MAG: VCBS repeat-containing protein [Planctomycetes bacterium]|nr:VCBS repeat-containing protein [Planctomycetota bacterium]